MTAHGQDRQLAVERDEGFVDQRLPAQQLPDVVDIAGAPQHRLSLAVIAQPPRLEHARQTNRGNGRGQVVAAVHGDETGRGNVQFREEALLGKPILRGGQRDGWGVDGHALRQVFRCGHRHVLELVGDHVQPVGKVIQQIQVGVTADQMFGQVTGGRIRRRVEETKTQAQRVASQRQHPPQLASS